MSFIDEEPVRILRLFLIEGDVQVASVSASELSKLFCIAGLYRPILGNCQFQ
jgi:hypothetical protein